MKRLLVLFYFFVFSDLIASQIDKKSEMLDLSQKLSLFIDNSDAFSVGQVQENLTIFMDIIKASNNDYTISDVQKIFKNDVVNKSFEKIKFNRKGSVYTKEYLGEIELELNALAIAGRRSKLFRDIEPEDKEKIQEAVAFAQKKNKTKKLAQLFSSSNGKKIKLAIKNLKKFNNRPALNISVEEESDLKNNDDSVIIYNPVEELSLIFETYEKRKIRDQLRDQQRILIGEWKDRE